ncbi:MAG: hypothetical protein ACLGG9_06040 [Thermoleophilia bacterium]|jgi:hypothetical protein
MSEPTPTDPAEGPTQEEFARALAERLAHTPVRDVLFQSLITFLDMAAIRLGLGPAGPEVADPAQARQAIEAARALIGVAEREMGAAQVRPFLEPLAQIQMAYARVVEAAGGAAEGSEQPSETPPAAQPGPPPGPDPASRLWVPPGTRG